MNRGLQIVESVLERDIDFLLVEELNVNVRFVHWLVYKIGLPAVDTVSGAWRSITDYGLGETDILLSYYSKGNTVFILLENKLDASFQEEQHHRYIQRCEKYVDEGKCDIAVEVLVAPMEYCTKQSDFDNYITYEDISVWLVEAGDERSLYKSEILTIAVEKLRRGYAPLNSEVVQQFWHSYWSLKNEMLPEFKMKEPMVVPVNSDWPVLSTDALPNVRFYHKWKQGNVDATFTGLLEQEILQLENKCSEPFMLIRHSASCSLRLKSEEIDRLESFDSQREKVLKGYECMRELKKYIHSLSLS